MKWETIKKAIEKECIKSRKSSYYTNEVIEYAQSLYDRNFPIIFSPEHLSLRIGVDYSYLCSMAYSTNLFYRHFAIKKKNGKLRQIDEPLPDLKYVQEWILHNILEKCDISKYAKAYAKGKTLKDNAKYHRSQKYVVTIDIKDFFTSISVTDITKIFIDIGYYKTVSCFLAHLCCLNHVLPQGAPTSPYLSNLRMLGLDGDISEYAKSIKVRYTRYSDDLTFSGDFNPHILISKVGHLLWKNGFSINGSKTRVAKNNCRQEVTGIIVNNHMQISRKQRRRIRQEMYYINKYGMDSHLDHIKETRGHYINHLLGKINFALFVNPKDQEMKRYFDKLVNIKRQN